MMTSLNNNRPSSSSATQVTDQFEVFNLNNLFPACFLLVFAQSEYLKSCWNALGLQSKKTVDSIHEQLWAITKKNNRIRLIAKGRTSLSVQ